MLVQLIGGGAYDGLVVEAGRSSGDMHPVLEFPALGDVEQAKKQLTAGQGWSGPTIKFHLRVLKGGEYGYIDAALLPLYGG